MSKNVRLSNEELNIIKQTAQEIFGKDVKVYLFGSRANPDRKGGDIDIFIETEKNVSIKDEISFLSTIEIKGVERKVDLVVKAPNKKEKPIFKLAKETGVLI